MRNCYFKPTKTGFEYTGELDECIKEAEIDLFNLKLNAKLCLGRTVKEKERLKKILETKTRPSTSDNLLKPLRVQSIFRQVSTLFIPFGQYCL